MISTAWHGVDRLPGAPYKRALPKDEEAIKSGDKKAAADALKAAQPDIQRGATARVIAKNAAARRVSRLNARIKAMA